MKYSIISMAMFCLLCCKCMECKAQEKVDLQKTELPNTKISVLYEPFDVFYKRADSLNIAQPSVCISNTLIKELKEKDKGLPYHFISSANALYTSNPEKLDEVAILMFVGLIRYDYYIGIYPSYAPNGEGWATTNSFKKQEKLRVDLYLQNNIEKYKAILKYAINYCSENEYKFPKQQKDVFMFKKNYCTI